MGEGRGGGGRMVGRKYKKKKRTREGHEKDKNITPNIKTTTGTGREPVAKKRVSAF